jgi:DNA-binding SARP family transcriptional activator/TolB-like protein/Tfp pilus assembly protein PilF
MMLDLRLLGSFYIGGPTPLALPKKTQALLAYLAMQGDRPITRDQLVALLWDDSDAEHGRRSLRQCLTGLRRDLGDSGRRWLQSSGAGVRLMPCGDVEIDTQRFEALALCPATNDLAAAVELYRGELLAGFDVASEPFMEWLAGERERFRSIASDVLLRLAAAQESDGQRDAGIASGQRLVTIDPLREDAHRLLMRLYASVGRRAEALRQFQVCSEILQHELGVAPDGETVELANRIRQEGMRSSAQTRVRAVVPAPSSIPGAADHQETDAPEHKVGSPISSAWLLISRKRATAIAVVLLVLMSAAAVLSLSHRQIHDAPVASIMVLPFANLSGDPEQAYFADAVTEDVTIDLSRVVGMRVISHASTLNFKGKSVDPRQLGRELDIRYVLKGGISRGAGEVAANFQLIDAQSGIVLNAERFEEKLGNLYELERSITGRIGVALALAVTTVEGHRAWQEDRGDLDARDLVWRGRALWMQAATPERTLTARKLFDEAAQRDPRSADAWGRLAVALLTEYFQHWNGAGEPELQRAEMAVNRALSLDPNFALAHLAAAYAFRFRGDHQAALLAIDQALALDRNYAMAHAQKGQELINLGQPEEAASWVQRAIALSPRDPALGLFHSVIGQAHFFMGDYAGAIPWLERSIQLRPASRPPRLYLIAAQALLGEVDRARSGLQEAERAGHRLRSSDLAGYDHLPNSTAQVVAGAAKLHEGLRLAGLSER